IDTISVVARSPYLVLFSRIGHYEPRWLDELLAEGKLFEYWSHAACFLPIDDYPLYRTQQLALERYGFKRAPQRIDADPVGHLNLLDHVRETGAVRASDFEHEGGRKGNGWWDWKPDKLRLETLYTAGEIMVARRENFHRIYDLRERVLPKRFLNDDIAHSHESMVREFSLRAVKAMGIAQARWIGDYFRHAAKTPEPDPETLVDKGELIRVQVEGWKNAAYVHRDHRALLKAAQSDRLMATHSTLLSPFDPLVWDRERALATWNFDYRIECYTPEAKRKYGYFTLPMLVMGTLLGRLDAKAHRQSKVFELKSMHFESMPQLNWAMNDSAVFVSLVDAIVNAASWHGAKKCVIGRIQAPGLDRKSERLLCTKLLPAINRGLAETNTHRAPWT
ncbi:MAG: winged helix-turn-helix domain-containing protein, partial [Casimicrobium sp.]